MKLSVITICYNIKDEIERTCESIVSQTNQDFEWIVVDGGSTDGTVDILNKYKSHMTVFISEKDKGIYNAMNKGIKRAKGEYLNFMNGGDSFASPDVVEQFYNCSAFGADVVYGNTNIIEKKKEWLKRYPTLINKEFLYRNCLGHQASFIKRKLFDKYGLYNEKYKIVSDWEQWIIFLENSCVFKHWDKTVANFYYNGISSVFTSDHLQERENVINTHFTLKEIKRFKKVKPRKFKIHLFNFIPLIYTENFSDGKKIIYKLFGFIPLYKIKRTQNKSKHYLFNFIPVLKIKG